MLWKCWTQYASKFGKQQWPHDWKRSVFIQSQRRAMPKNVQITVKLHSLHMLVRLCSKSFKLCFNGTWTENFHMYKLDLEKAEEPEIKLPIFVGSWRKQESSRKTSTSASLTMLKPGLENFEHYFPSMWDECKCAVVWAFFGIAFLWNWNENWPFPVLWLLLFSKFAGILSAALSQHHLSGFEIAQLIGILKSGTALNNKINWNWIKY